jgi:antitoxin ParD1/3/4
MATKNTSFALSERFAALAERLVREERYASTSEVIREGLRLLEAREAKLDRLKALLAEGEATGFVEDFDFDGYVDAIRDGDEPRQAA